MEQIQERGNYAPTDKSAQGIENRFNCLIYRRLFRGGNEQERKKGKGDYQDAEIGKIKGGHLNAAERHAKIKRCDETADNEFLRNNDKRGRNENKNVI